MPVTSTFASLSARAYGLFSSADVPYWAATLGSSIDEYGTAVATDSSGNLYSTGYAYNSTTGNRVLTAKYNAAGVIQWQRLLASAANLGAIPYGVAVDTSGNVYVTGEVGITAFVDNIFVAKYNSSGTLQWQRTLASGTRCKGRGVAVDSSANVYIAGWVDSGIDYIIFAKYDTNGVIQWQKQVDAPSGSYYEAHAIAVDASNDVYISGSGDKSGSIDIYVGKFNSAGGLQWHRSLGGTVTDEGFGVAVDAASNVYITGASRDPSTFRYSIVTAKYNSSGTIQWQRALSTTVNAYGYSIAVDAANNPYVAGIDTAVSDLYFAKYDTSGNIIWQRLFGGTGTDENPEIVVNPLGVMSIVGTEYSTGTGQGNVLMVRLPGNGTRTGTYGDWTYQTASLTGSTSTLTDVAAGLNVSSASLTDAAGTMVASTATYTSTVTPI